MRTVIFALSILIISSGWGLKAQECNLVVKDSFRGFVTQIKPKMLLVIHGGLSSMNKSYEMCKKALSIAPKDYGVASLDFSTSTIGGKEVEEAVLMAQWLSKEGAQSIGLLGESHGAYIALMASLYIKPAFVVDIAGPTDMAGMYAYFKKHPDIFKDWIKAVEMTKAKCIEEEKSEETCLAELSPVNYAGFMNFPILIVHGTLDKTVPLEQSLKLARKLIRFKNKDIWLFIFPEEHSVDFSQEPVRSLILNFINPEGEKDGVSGSAADQKEHKALPEQAGGEGKDRKNTGSSPLGTIGKE